MQSFSYICRILNYKKMGKRKIFEKQTVDVQTGELISTTAEYVSDNRERFFMGRTTEGIEWMFKFKNLTELQLLIMMMELESQKNRNIITFTNMQVKEAAEIIGVSEAMITKCITNLIKADFLTRVSKSNYLANPLTFYKGGTKELPIKYKTYLSYTVKEDKKEETVNSLNNN